VNANGHTLQGCRIKVQTTLVASPRNHLYRTDRSLIEVGLFRIGSNAKLDHFCDLADNLDFEPIFDRSYRDVLIKPRRMCTASSLISESSRARWSCSTFCR
jgi:hypothetical protein